MLRDARQKAGFFLSDSLEVTNFSPRVPQIAVSCPDYRAQCALPTCLRSISEVQPGRTDLPGSKMAELCSLASNLFRNSRKDSTFSPTTRNVISSHPADRARHSSDNKLNRPELSSACQLFTDTGEMSHRVTLLR